MEITDTKELRIQLEDQLKMIDEEKISRRLGHVNNQVPKTNCGACFKCCFASAQVYSLEFLNEDEIDKAKTETIKEFQPDGTTRSVKRLLSEHGFQI